MEIHLDFTKPTISKNIGAFLTENLKTKGDIESIKRILKGNKVQYADANRLLWNILSAMILSDGKEEEEIAHKPNSENPENECEKLDDQILTQVPTYTQSQIQKDKAEEHKKKEYPSTSSQLRNVLQKSAEKDHSKYKTEVQKLCHFYTKGVCKFGKECRFEHPKYCQKFKTHGLKKFNDKGCEESCNKFHPRACFESMKSKTCNRNDCKYYHLTGTKIITKQYEGHQTNSQPYQGQKLFQTSNKYNPLSMPQTSELTQESVVFQKSTAPWEIAIEKIASQMEKMIKWQHSFMEQDKSKTLPMFHPQKSSQNWANANLSQNGPSQWINQI